MKIKSVWFVVEETTDLSWAVVFKRNENGKGWKMSVSEQLKDVSKAYYVELFQESRYGPSQRFAVSCMKQAIKERNEDRK